MVQAVVLVLVTVALATYSQLVWKARSNAHVGIPGGWFEFVVAMFSDPWIWSGFCAVGLGTISWMLVLRRADLSLAYPATALVFVLVPIGAHVLLGEALPLMRIVGLALVVFGVALVAATR